MVYVVRVSCHIHLDIYLDIHLDIYLDIYLDIHLNVYLNVYLDIPQSVNAIRVHSLVFPSSSTVNLRS